MPLAAQERPQLPSPTATQTRPFSTIASVGNGSHTRGAEEFGNWLYEVLPSFHKHNAYMRPQTIEEAIDDPNTIIKIATNLKKDQRLLAEKE